MSQDARDYYSRRAEAELALARAAATPEAARAHATLAACYLNRVDGGAAEAAPAAGERESAA